MKIAGMIGGLGPESTLDYYKLLIALYRKRRPDAEYPSLIINSVDFATGLRLVTAGQLDELADFLADGVDRLTKAGAAFAFFSANTPHIVFDQVQRRAAIPMISIVTAARDRAHAMGLKRVGIFGTRFTMQAKFFPEEFAHAGIAVLTPSDSEQAFIHEKYLGELIPGRFLPETRDHMLQIAARMKADNGIEALILAGTELPLLLRGAPTGGLEFLDTTEIHVEAIIDEMLR